MTVDVLDDDDRVVHDEACRDRQRHQREVVEAVAEKVHRAERPEQRQRNRNAWNDGRAGTAQEHEHHQYDQKDGQHERALDVLHRGADGGRTVDGGVEIDRGGEQCAKFRQQRLYAVDRLDDVGACLAEHLQLDRRLAVREPGDADVLDRVPDASEIGEPYGRAVTVRHDQRLVVGRLHQLIRRADLERRRCVGHLTFGTVRIRGAQHRSNLIEAEVCTSPACEG